MKPQLEFLESEEPAERFSWGGFSLSSNIALPRLFATTSAPDMQFRWREKPCPRTIPVTHTRLVHRLDGGCLEIGVGGAPESLIYHVVDLGGFVLRVPDRSIEFFPTNDADPWLVEHFLVNSVLPIYAGLAGVVSLHAAAVARDGRAVSFAGPSGVGKSTSAMCLLEQGWMLLSDDAAVLRKCGGVWMVFPAARTYRTRGTQHLRGREIYGKTESFAIGQSRPAQLQTINLLRLGEEASSRLAPSCILRSLVGLQPGWQWADVTTRGRLEDMTWDLMRETEVFLQTGTWSQRRRAGVAPL